MGFACRSSKPGGGGESIAVMHGDVDLTGFVGTNCHPFGPEGFGERERLVLPVGDRLSDKNLNDNDVTGRANRYRPKRRNQPAIGH